MLPTRNRAGWIGRAVESVLAQSHTAVELLVVDDGSTDETRAVLQRFGSRLTLLSQAPSGVYPARNLGLRHATGEFVAFIDSDDRWHPHRLAVQLPLLRRPGVALVFGDAIHVRPDGRPTRRRPRTCFQTTPPRRGHVAEHFAWGNFVPTIAVLARRACLEAVGGFPITHKVSADQLTWFRIAAQHELDYVASPIADYTVHPGGISSDLGRALQARIELFEAELESTTDHALAVVLRRVVFNLGMHLAVATVRGTGNVPGAWRTACRAVAVAAAEDRLSWSGAFFAEQTRRRVRRSFPMAGPGAAATA